MFEGSIRRACRFQSLTSMLPGIHFPAPGRPQFLLAGCVDIVGIANAVLHRHLAGYDLINSALPHSLPCSPWAAAYAALAHSVSLAGDFWDAPCSLVPVDPCCDVSPQLPIFDRYPISMDETYGYAECLPSSCTFSSPSSGDLADDGPTRLFVDNWDTLHVRVFLRRVSVRNAMEVARLLALAAISWGVPSAAWVPVPAAVAAAADALGGDAFLPPPPTLPCAPPCPCHMGSPSPLSCAVLADLAAARAAELGQEHRPWLNHPLLVAPGGVDVVALANVIISADAALMEDRIQYYVTGAQRLSLPGWRGRPC